MCCRWFHYLLRCLRSKPSGRMRAWRPCWGCSARQALARIPHRGPPWSSWTCNQTRCSCGKIRAWKRWSLYRFYPDHLRMWQGLKASIDLTVIGNKDWMVVQINCMNDLKLLLAIRVEYLLYVDHWIILTMRLCVKGHYVAESIWRPFSLFVYESELVDILWTQTKLDN